MQFQFQFGLDKFMGRQIFSVKEGFSNYDAQSGQMTGLSILILLLENLLENAS